MTIRCAACGKRGPMTAYVIKTTFPACYTCYMLVERKQVRRFLKRVGKRQRGKLDTQGKYEPSFEEYP